MTTTDQATSKAGEMTSAAKQEGGAVAQSATQAGKEVVGAVSERTAAVADTAKQQLHTMVGQAKQEFRSQAESQGSQVVTGLRTLSDQVVALTEGRRDESGQLGSFVDDAQQRLQRYVGSLEDRGPQAIVDDVTRFARRRPGVFLLGAGVAGFAIGRLVRGAAAEHASSDGSAYASGSSWANPGAVSDSQDWGTSGASGAGTGGTGVVYSASGPHADTAMSTPGGAPSAADMPLDAPLGDPLIDPIVDPSAGVRP